jgi:nucleoside-diphosphate-sugar epimerase
VNLPGITVSVAEMLEGLRRVAGAPVVRRVRFEADARIQAIVRTWPGRFETPRALAMGFRADADVETVIRDYIADEGIKVA